MGNFIIRKGSILSLIPGCDSMSKIWSNLETYRKRS